MFTAQCAAQKVAWLEFSSLPMLSGWSSQTIVVAIVSATTMGNISVLVSLQT